MPKQRLPGEERRGSILDAAIDVFSRGGFRGATTAALAQAAGITEALLYRHFRSKKALFLGALAHVLDRVEREVAARLDAHDDPVAGLESLFGYFHEQLREDPQFGHLIYLVASELRDPEVRRAYVRAQDRILSRLEAAIARWASQGQLRAGVDPRAAAWLILGAHQTLTLMEQCGRLDEMRPEHVRGFVSAFLAEEPKKERSARSGAQHHG
ncbi:MAG: TetR/AcrR family transcriptional regulator [Sandaracinaceae bacterium]|nr:TetR/AcrR family transcriptional regulator [Sandaracinaceae bacterium]